MDFIKKLKTKKDTEAKPISFEDRKEFIDKIRKLAEENLKSQTINNTVLEFESDSDYETELETDIPEEFMCPFTKSIMNDPVICEDGYTYEKSAVLQLENPISPITEKTIDINKLVPNRALKISIKKFTES